MSRAPHAYPPELARYVGEHWPGPHAIPVSHDLLEEALSVAFQASLTSEEGRPTRFRLLLTPVERLPTDGVPNDGVLRLRFDHARAFSADELRRLSPSAAFESALVGAHEEAGKLRIWGIAHSGPGWLAPTWGGRSVVSTWSRDPIIHVTGPGRLAVRSAGKLVAALERGTVSTAMLDVVESHWLPALFERERNLIVAQHATVQATSLSPTLAEHSLVGRVSQHLLRRAIQLVRGARHGGLLLVVDPQSAGERALSGIRLKYSFAPDEPAQRYRSLLLQLLSTLAERSDKASIGWSDFEADGSPDLERLERAVFEQSRLIANLTGIDGAVVLDKTFGLVGYGAEVSAELPAPRTVWRAHDTEGHELSAFDVENVGTRHRAAYRFVEEHPSALAIVVSQDGGVSFVVNRAGEVVLWEQSVSP